ncbi:tetratricopeptide repeat protein [Archangium violaceum]|nr:tetratricopeptide repeat protein [Archangium violaceum]
MLFGVGCAGLRARATCPAEGGKPWREVKSTHFRVRTNLSAEAAEKTAVELEQFRRALLLAWDSEFDPPGEVEAIVLRNPEELEEFTDGNVAGFATTGENGPLLVMSGGSLLRGESSVDHRVQLHELAHYLSGHVFLRQPRWFAEGFASYLETLQFRGGPVKVILGRPSNWKLGYVRAQGWMSLEELWAWRTTDGMSKADRTRHYASAWLWVHYLMNVHGEQFADFQGRLARAEEPRQAFDASFQGVKDLAGGLRSYVDTGRYAILTLPLPEVPSKVETRELDGAEIHAIRARLHLMNTGSATWEQRRQLAEKEVAQALREDPTNVSAVFLRSMLSEDESQRLALARELVKARPDSGRAWAMLGNALERSGGSAVEREQALMRAVELQPQDASVLNNLAWFYVGTNNPQKAFELAKRAVTLAPENPAILDTYAAVLFQSGRCPESLRLQRRALDMLHESTPEPRRRSFQDALDKYEQACGQPPGQKP